MFTTSVSSILMIMSPTITLSMIGESDSTPVISTPNPYSCTFTCNPNLPAGTVILQTFFNLIIAVPSSVLASLKCCLHNFVELNA